MELIKKKNTFTPEQLAFIEANSKWNIILKATAGSGKTYCVIERVRFLLASGVPPEKIIMFSYTTAAVEEVKKRLNNDSVRVTTIHAFCLSMLAKMQKFKKIVDIYEFINWYKDKYKPKAGAKQSDKEEFFDFITHLYDDAQYIASEITAFKLQTADGIKCRPARFFHEYKQFTKETKSRDFSDMLIEVRDLLKDNKWLRLFKNQFDYIFVDEFQDTSTIQMNILLALNAKYYTIIGDIAQSIFLYSGANAEQIIDMLKKRRECHDMALSTNFRSAKTIVENSNLYSDLQAVPFSQEEGIVHKEIILFEELFSILRKNEEVAILARTNTLIKDIEKRMLLRKEPLKYFNYITEQERKDLKKGEQRPSTQKKVKALLPVYKTVDNLIMFIEQNQNHKSFVTSIHKSKGREFEVCVVVNSVSPEILSHNDIHNLTDDQFKEISFDPANPDDYEARNVHYVAVSRPKKELYYMLLNV